MRNNFIYGLCDPNTFEVRYIGYSSRGMVRPKSHFYKSSLKRKSHRSSWIKSLDGKSPIIVVLEYAKTKEDLPSLEIKWIKFGLNSGWRLTNHTLGGDGILNYSHTEESKAKISKAGKGRIGFWKDKKLSKSTRQKMSKSRLKGKSYIDPADKCPQRSNTNKNIYISPKDEIFYSSYEAAKCYGVAPSTIRSWSNNEVNSWSCKKLSEVTVV